MTSPTILTTRALTYIDQHGETQRVDMNLLMRIDEEGDPRIGLRFGPPVHWEKYHPKDDVLHSITYVLAMWWARLILGGMPLAGNLRWRDSFNCGLPAIRARPDTWVPPEIPPAEQNPGNLEVLSASAVPFPDEMGTEHELPIFVFMPKQAADGFWRCGFGFGAKDISPVRYGKGEDFIESFLDAASMIRLVYDAMLPKDYEPGDGVGCGRLPYKIGRAYYIDAEEDRPG